MNVDSVAKPNLIISKYMKVVFKNMNLDLNFKSIDLKCFDFKSIDFRYHFKSNDFNS